MKYMTYYYQSIGRRIKYLRELLGLNQDEVGTPENGYVQSNLLWAIEKGEKYGENQSYITQNTLNKIIEGFKYHIEESNKRNHSQINIKINKQSILFGDRSEVYNLVHELYNYIAFNFENFPPSLFRKPYYNNFKTLYNSSSILKYVFCYSAFYAINRRYIHFFYEAYRTDKELIFNDIVLDNHEKMVRHFWVMRSNELITNFEKWIHKYINSFKKINDETFYSWIEDDFQNCLKDLFNFFQRLEKYNLGYYTEDMLNNYTLDITEFYKYTGAIELSPSQKLRKTMYNVKIDERIKTINNNISTLLTLAVNQDIYFFKIFTNR